MISVDDISEFRVEGKKGETRKTLYHTLYNKLCNKHVLQKHRVYQKQISNVGLQKDRDSNEIKSDAEENIDDKSPCPMMTSNACSLMIKCALDSVVERKAGHIQGT